MDGSLRLLQALNDKHQAAIDECVAAEGAKDWINYDVDPKQLDNPVREFKDVTSITCLTFASLVNDVQTVRQLVESGADPTVTDSEGCSVLHYACASRVDAQAKVTYLLQRDASLVNAYNHSENAVLASREKTTPLHVAAQHNQTDCVRTVINDGKALVNPTDGIGRTALRIAARTRQVEVVNVLVQHPSCDFSIRDREGLTAAECDRRWGDSDIAALIDAKSKGSFTKHFVNIFAETLLVYSYRLSRITASVVGTSLSTLLTPPRRLFHCATSYHRQWVHLKTQFLPLSCSLYLAARFFAAVG